MDYLVFQRELWNQISDSVAKTTNRIAVHMSAYPDPADLYLLLPKATSAIDTLINVWALEYCLPGVETRHQTYDQRLEISKMISLHRREGKWTIVEELIQQPQGFFFLEEVLIENFSPEDIFGNLVPKLKRVIASVTPVSKKVQEQKNKQKKVKEKVFRRGYADHGTLRPSHKWLPWNAYSEPEAPERETIDFYIPRRNQWVPLEDTKQITRGLVRDHSLPLCRTLFSLTPHSLERRVRIKGIKKHLKVRPRCQKLYDACVEIGKRNTHPTTSYIEQELAFYARELLEDQIPLQ